MQSGYATKILKIVRPLLIYHNKIQMEIAKKKMPVAIVYEYFSMYLLIISPSMLCIEGNSLDILSWQIIAFYVSLWERVYDPDRKSVSFLVKFCLQLKKEQIISLSRGRNRTNRGRFQQSLRQR
jgi:hypothetical protein